MTPATKSGPRPHARPDEGLDISKKKTIIVVAVKKSK